MSFGARLLKSVTPISGFVIAYSKENRVRWTVWLGAFRNKINKSPIARSWFFQSLQKLIEQQCFQEGIEF